MNSEKGFNLFKTIQAIHFLVSQLGETNFMKLIKLMYFADRHHLRHYGFTITSDEYFAMKHGPVGSATKDVLKEDSFFFYNLDLEDKQYFECYLISCQDYVKSNQTCNYDELSVSEKEALDFSLKYFGDFSEFQLANITHDYPEWKKYKQLFDDKLAKRKEMNTIDFFGNPMLKDSPFLNLYLKNEDPFSEDQEVLSNIREYILEQESVF